MIGLFLCAGDDEIEDQARIHKLCLEYTALLDTGICQLESLGKQLLRIATLNDTDIFIDAPLKQGCARIVLAWAHADTLSSLYKKVLSVKLRMQNVNQRFAERLYLGKKVQMCAG